MNKKIILSIAVFAAIIAAIYPYFKVKLIVGDTYKVTFSKNFYVLYLSNREYSNLKLTSASTSQLCFFDQTNKFNNENMGQELQINLISTHPPITTVELQENPDGSFCVPLSDVLKLANTKTSWQRWFGAFQY